MPTKNTIFCASLPDIDDADDLLCEIRSEINRVARTVFGEGAHTMIHLGRWKWVASICGRNYETLAEGSDDTLTDALHALKQALEAKRLEADNLNRTLGIWA